MDYLDLFAKCLCLEKIEEDGIAFYRTSTGTISEQQLLNDPIYEGFRDCMDGKRFPLITKDNMNYVKGFCAAGRYKVDQYFRKVAIEKCLDPDELLVDRKDMITN